MQLFIQHERNFQMSEDLFNRKSNDEKCFLFEIFRIIIVLIGKKTEMQLLQHFTKKYGLLSLKYDTKHVVCLL